MIYFCVKFQKDQLFGVNLTFFAPWLPWQRPPFLNLFNPPKSCHTLRWIFLQSFMKFDERNPKIFLIPPFLFPWQLLAKFVQPIPIFVVRLSRSTRCGCCSYQVSSISVWRVTCYDHFCVFQFFWHFGRFHGNSSHFEKNQPLTAQLHMAYDIPTRLHKVCSRHPREIERTKMCGRIIRRIRITSNCQSKRRIADMHPIPIILEPRGPW